jgi:hypothetical protein
MGLCIGGVAVAPPRPDVGVDSEDISDALAGIVDARADAPTSIPADFSSVRRVGSVKPLPVLDDFILIALIGEVICNNRAIDVPFGFIDSLNPSSCCIYRFHGTLKDRVSYRRETSLAGSLLRWLF